MKSQLRLRAASLDSSSIPLQIITKSFIAVVQRKDRVRKIKRKVENDKEMER